MHKVIFADDEAVFRTYFKNVIDWRAHGFELIGEAKNGLEALELIERDTPDIAFIDINMPYMNGMDLAAKIKEKHPSVFVLLVTGHSEFEYARQALKIGVDDYILKPFDEEELIVALAKIKGEMEKHRIERDKTLKERQVWKESFLNLLISNEYADDNETIREQLEAFQMSGADRVFQVASVEMDNLHEQWPDPGEIRLRKYIIANLLSDLIQIGGASHHFTGPENRVVSLLQYSDEQAAERFAPDGYARLCALISKHFGFRVTVGLGTAGQGIPSIRRSYKESVIALRNKISMNRSDVLVYRDMTSQAANIGFYPSEMNENLLIHLRLHEEEKIKEALGEIRQYIRDRQLSGEYIHMIMAGLVSLCLTYIYEIGKQVDDFLPPSFSPFEAITNKSSLDEAFEWIADLYLSVAGHSRNMKRSRSGNLLTSAREYIDAHYMDSQLKVEDVAKHFYIQPRYLLKIFKEGLGMSVSDYLFETRMQKAKELLTSGRNLRLTNVAEMVGYGDPAHFSKSFKRHTGLSPSEYEATRQKG
ncbi:two-component system response regulator YesN [Cohnella sp. SGD-V74]|uniref:response regulator n=1 Tax=unclassified Cohnella TaxID=2636738 RepID=UPI000D40951C|nr:MULTISPECIES: response regulator [unclassified Cohnella]PRX61092.1 two-component system response regulator YesN [Cohnella sp. SGD-V74]